MSRLSLDDTITAIATPPGEGALGIVRLSGPDALAIAERLFRPAQHTALSRARSHTVHVGHIVDGDVLVDEVCLTVLRGPRTYTREDMAEITGHGSMLALRRILELTLHAGARLAEPGEFTQRAFLNGRIDLAQGEAVLDIIRARTATSLRTAIDQLGGHLSQHLARIHEALANLVAHVEAMIDFPEEDVEFLRETHCAERLQHIAGELERLIASAQTGRLVRDGATVVICGRPNVGKSSVLNALLKTHRAIVTPIPGTTRDTIEEWLNLRGLPIQLIDTAGLTTTDDPIEQEGVARSRQAIQRADLVLMIFDGSMPMQAMDHEVLTAIRALRGGTAAHTMLVINKRDLPSQFTAAEATQLWDAPLVEISASEGHGLARLEAMLHQQLWNGAVDISDGALVTNVRHREALRRALASCRAALEALARHETVECVAVDLRQATAHVGDILGLNVHEDVLDRIFRQFCIGK